MKNGGDRYKGHAQTIYSLDNVRCFIYSMNNKCNIFNNFGSPEFCMITKTLLMACQSTQRTGCAEQVIIVCDIIQFCKGDKNKISDDYLKIM